MGCGGSVAAAQEPRPRAQASNGVELVPGQSAIIRNCPNARLNGEQVIVQEYNEGLREWTVKGNKFPLSVGMSLSAQFLEVVEPAHSNGVELAPGQSAIIRNCPNARLNGEQVIVQEYNEGLGEWTVKGNKFPLSVGMSLSAQFLEVVEPAPTLLTSDNENCQQCANQGMVEFTDTDGDKVVIKDNNALGMAFYVNGAKVVDDLIKLQVSDHTIRLEGYSADKFAAATVPIGQEHILKQALNLFADIQSGK